MAVRARPAAVLFFAVASLAQPGVAQVTPPTPQPGMVLVGALFGADGARTQFEISQERSDTLPAWDQQATPEPPLSMSAARKAAEAWLMARDPSIKTLEVTNLYFGRGARATEGWYSGWSYRIAFAPVPGSRLTGSQAFTVAVLLDGSVVEPRRIGR